MSVRAIFSPPVLTADLLSAAVTRQKRGKRRLFRRFMTISLTRENVSAGTAGVYMAAT